MKIRFWDFWENISTFERNQRRWQQHSKCRCFFEQGRSHFEIMLQCSIFLTDTQHRQHSCMIYITYVGCIHIWHKFAANCATGIRDGRAKQRSTKIRFFCSAVAVAEFSVGFSCRPKRRACALRTCFHEFLHVYQVATFLQTYILVHIKGKQSHCRLSVVSTSKQPGPFSVLVARKLILRWAINA